MRSSCLLQPAASAAVGNFAPRACSRESRALLFTIQSSREPPDCATRYFSGDFVMDRSSLFHSRASSCGGYVMPLGMVSEIVLPRLFASSFSSVAVVCSEQTGASLRAEPANSDGGRCFQVQECSTTHTAVADFGPGKITLAEAGHVSLHRASGDSKKTRPRTWRCRLRLVIDRYLRTGSLVVDDRCRRADRERRIVACLRLFSGAATRPALLLPASIVRLPK